MTYANAECKFCGRRFGLVQGKEHGTKGKPPVWSCQAHKHLITLPDKPKPSQPSTEQPTLF